MEHRDYVTRGGAIRVAAGLDPGGHASLKLERLTAETNWLVTHDYDRLFDPADVEITLMEGGADTAGALAAALRFAADALEDASRRRYVWSALRLLAHDPNCRWSEEIADENRRTGDLDEAVTACIRPCLVCQPIEPHRFTKVA